MSNLGVLTEDERKIANWVADGKTASQIAYALGIPQSTVESRIETILKKMQVSNRVQLAYFVGLERRDHRYGTNAGG